jgi:hypothetical protein
VWWRKHHRGSYAADLWMVGLEEKSFEKLLDSDPPDNQKASNFWPSISGDGRVIVYEENFGLRRGPATGARCDFSTRCSR